jgi:hypothetical protein
VHYFINIVTDAGVITRSISVALGSSRPRRRACHRDLLATRCVMAATQTISRYRDRRPGAKGLRQAGRSS